MNEDSNPNFPTLSLDDRLVIENLCSEFDREWLAQGDSPSIGAYLSRVGEFLQEAMLEELIRIDREYRQRQGKPQSMEEYVKEFPRWARAVHRAHRDRAVEDFKSDSIESDATNNTDWLLAAQQAKEIFELVRRFQHEGMASASPSTQDPTEWMDRQAPLIESIQKTLAGFQRNAPVRNGIPSQRLGDFQIVRQIGRGGMGAVFEAEQISLKRKVALKILWVSTGQQEEARERFQREATTVANLHHTNIVPIFAVGEEQGFDYYAMQLIDGQSLDIVLRQAKEDLDWKKVANWGLQAAEALSHAHERGVVHRDVKPSNLILDSSARIWLTDFGLAKSPDDQSLSFAGAMIGTPRYMSPEQASAASNSVDHRSDIYSLGASLYELLSGRPVFDGDSPLQVIQQILKEEPKRLDRIQPEVPRDLVTVVMKCLNKDPSQRYASAKELADDLRSVSEGRPIKARRTSALEVLGKWLKRHATVVRNVGAIVVVTSFVLGIAIWSLASWKSYRLAKLRLKSSNGSVVASVFNAEGKQVGSSVSLPTQTPIEIEAGRYQVRLASPGVPSIESSLMLDPQSSVEFEVDPQESLVCDPLPERLGYRVLEEPKGTVVSWDANDFRFESELDRPIPLRQAWKLSELKWKSSVKHVVGLGRVDSKGHVEVVVTQSKVSSVWAIASDRGLLWKQSFAQSESEDSLDQENDVRGDILAPPMLVDDADGDGHQDLLVTIGQNPKEPRTDVEQVHRFVALLSGNTGRILWRYDIPKELFAGRGNQPIPKSLWWELAEPFQTGTQNQSDSIVRQGRLLRHLNRTTMRNAPHCEVPQVQLIRTNGIPRVGVQCASQLQLLQLENGTPIENTRTCDVFLDCLPSFWMSMEIKAMICW
ncbi:MAG: serine/threonine-protein kinase [Pirellulales bacterium]